MLMAGPGSRRTRGSSAPKQAPPAHWPSSPCKALIRHPPLGVGLCWIPQSGHTPSCGEIGEENSAVRSYVLSLLCGLRCIRYHHASRRSQGHLSRRARRERRQFCCTTGGHRQGRRHGARGHRLCPGGPLHAHAHDLCLAGRAPHRLWRHASRLRAAAPDAGLPEGHGRHGHVHRPRAQRARSAPAAAFPFRRPVPFRRTTTSPTPTRTRFIRR